MSIKLISFNEVKVSKEPDQLIKGLIPRVGVSVIWGSPKTGKSFLALDVSVHVARNQSYRGRKVNGGPVVYCCFEGMQGFNRRVEAIKRQNPYDGQTPLYIMPTRLDLITEYPKLIAAIKEHLPTPASTPSAEELRALIAADPKWQPPLTTGNGNPNPKVAAIVLDTLNRSFSGSESSDKDMAAYIHAADVLKETFGCAVIIVHHCGHEGTAAGQRPRGHSSLGGAVDAQLSVIRTPDDQIIAEVEWMKDGESGARLTSKLQTVEVGTDSDGDPITSCVVVPCDDALEAVTAVLPSKLRKALEALDAVTAADGSARLVDWREEMLDRHLFKKTQRMAFKRLKDGLVSAAQISIADDGSVRRSATGLRLATVDGVSVSPYQGV